MDHEYSGSFRAVEDTGDATIGDSTIGLRYVRVTIQAKTIDNWGADWYVWGKRSYFVHVLISSDDNDRKLRQHIGLPLRLFRSQTSQIGTFERAHRKSNLSSCQIMHSGKSEFGRSVSLEIREGSALPILTFPELGSANDDIAEHANVSSCNGRFELKRFSSG
jgi:hypothetical protein